MDRQSCSICGNSLMYVRCWHCGGYGDFALSDDWFDMLVCEECDGRGGWWVCPDAAQHGDSDRTSSIGSRDV